MTTVVVFPTRRRILRSLRLPSNELVSIEANGGREARG